MDAPLHFIKNLCALCDSPEGIPMGCGKEFKMEYIKLCKTSEVFNKRGKLFQIDDETEVVIFKVYDNFYAVDNVCPHNHSPLMYDGYIEDMYVACPVHGFRFHLETGEQPTQMGCKLRTFELKIENDYIYVKKPDRKIFDFKWD